MTKYFRWCQFFFLGSFFALDSICSWTILLIRILPGSFMDSSWLYLEPFLVPFWTLPGSFLDSSWFLIGLFLVPYWTLLGSFLDFSWSLLDSSWLLLGFFLISFWTILGSWTLWFLLNSSWFLTLLLLSGPCYKYKHYYKFLNNIPANIFNKVLIK